MQDVEVRTEATQHQALLVDAVREAGALALKAFRGTPKTWMKEGGSPVSETDMAVDAMLNERLRAALPEAGWLSEETEDDPARLAADLVWVVDPIDGTRAYIQGRPDWVISAALVAGARPVLAALYAPVTDELFVAVAGQGATLNGATIGASRGADIARARIAGPQRYLNQLSAALPDMVAMPKVHSLALRLARVAQGAFDSAFAARNAHDWDLAAADLLVHEAGGEMTTLAGNPIIYNRPAPVHDALVAAGQNRHGTLIQLIREQPDRFA